jgi:hypothetical protein
MWNGLATKFNHCGLEYDMSVPVPSEEKLRLLFEGEATRERVAESLLAPQYAEWRQAKLFHTWGMFAGFLPLNKENCVLALGELWSYSPMPLKAVTCRALLHVDRRPLEEKG